MSFSVRSLAYAVAAYGLPGTTTELPAEPLRDELWGPLLNTARGQRMSGQLALAIARLDLAATDRQREEAGESHLAEMSLALLLERTMLEVVELFDGLGVPNRVLMGSAAAHLDYPDPALRSFDDIDLLVPSPQFDAATRAITEAGHRFRVPEPRWGLDRRLSNGTTFPDSDDTEFNVHRALVMGPYGLTIDLDELWSSPSTFVLAAQPLQALRYEHRFLNACYHVVLADTPPRLVPLRDIAQLLLRSDFDVDEVRRLAERWRAEAVVAEAVRCAWETLSLADANALSFWAQHYEPEPWERRALSVYQRPDTSYAARSLASVSMIQGVSNKLAYLRALTFPERDHEGRHESLSERWRRGLRDLGR